MGQRRARILGVGSYVPPRVVTNNDLAQWMDTSNEWIVERTGIRERRWTEEGSNIGSSDLGVEAAQKALDAAGISPDQVDMVVFATLSPDFEFPGTGVFFQRKLGLRPMPVLDIRQQCTGFVYGLSIADQYVRSGFADHVLVVGAEVHSTGLNVTTEGRDVAVLFGDGAGAVVVGASDDPERGVIGAKLYADGTFAEQLWTEGFSSARHPRVREDVIREGRHYPYMNGRKVFKHAVTKMPQVVRELLAAEGFTVDDVACVIPHQANMRINELVQQALGLGPDRIHHNIQKYGNTTAASIPLCLDEALAEGKITPGDLVCLVAFGAGFTWGAALLRW
jgi:3-oxoacyl-[acyl-carrier-protein] synthase-3